MENPAPEDTPRRVSKVPPGSNQDRGMCEEKREDDRPEEGGALNSGDPERDPSRTIFSLRGDGRQPARGGDAAPFRESDSSIVVGDGRTVHMAKGGAERQSGQSTHARERNTPGGSVSSTLSALRTKAEQDPKHRFRALSRLLDRQMLGEAFKRLKRTAAPGIDGVSHAEYAKELERNLEDLEKRLKEGRYRARNVKRRWIAKPGSRKRRPLGIPALEDKIVQQAVRMILESIWEADFAEESIGYRAGRGARQASKDLREALNGGEYRWVVEADIRSFFDHIDHGWMVRMLKERVADGKLIRLIVKWLKAGVLEEDGQTVHPATGTPQGGVISPVLANIYLHFVQDLWIERVVRRRGKGRVLFRRYADDSVVCFEREEDARAYLGALPRRLTKFGLRIAEEKSSLVRFDRRNPDQSGKFTFLGFDYYWARTIRNPKASAVKRRTNREKFRSSLLAFKEWIKRSRSLPLAEIVAVLRRKLQGYWNYYGVRGNSVMLGRYEWAVKSMVHKWLNRRSQRRSMTWAAFARHWKSWQLPAARITECRAPTF